MHQHGMTKLSLHEDVPQQLSGPVTCLNADSKPSVWGSTYDDAPNPVLRLGDLGTVGLPLGVRDAAAIIEKSEQAPFGKGERTLVDKEVRDTWQMDAGKVRSSESDSLSILSSYSSVHDQHVSVVVKYTMVAHAPSPNTASISSSGTPIVSGYTVKK